MKISDITDRVRTFWRKVIEYARFGLWIPTQRIRSVKVLTINTGRGPLEICERQRLYFGRWGRWKWKREQRFAIVPETVH